MTALLCLGCLCLGIFLGFVLCAALVQSKDEEEVKMRNALSYADGFYDGRKASGAEL